MSFSLDPRLLGRALLPDYDATLPAGGEFTAFFPVTALILMTTGVAALRRAAPRARAIALVAFLGLFFALGGYNPLYYLLLKIPGFDLFRAPARWIVLFAFGGSLLAGGDFQTRNDIDHDGWADLAAYQRGVLRPRLYWTGGGGQSGFLTGGVTTKDILVFTRQFSVMIDAGLPLVQSLTILALILCAILIFTPPDRRRMLLYFIAGASLGYFLELWGTTRECWTYYTYQTPPLFAVLAHGMAAVAFWRAGLIVKMLWGRFSFSKPQQVSAEHEA